MTVSRNWKLSADHDHEAHPTHTVVKEQMVFKYVWDSKEIEEHVINVLVY